MGFEIRTLKRTISALALGALLLAGTTTTASAQGRGRGHGPNQRAWWGQTRRADNSDWRDRKHELKRHQKEERRAFKEYRRDRRDDYRNVGDRRDLNQRLRLQHRDLRIHQRNERETFRSQKRNSNWRHH